MAGAYDSNSYFHYQPPQLPLPPVQHYSHFLHPQQHIAQRVAQQTFETFDAYEPEPVNPLRGALDAAERQKAKAERLSGTLTRILELVVGESRGGGSSPTLRRLLDGREAGRSVIEDALAIAVDDTRARERAALQAMETAAAACRHDYGDGTVDYFGTNGGGDGHVDGHYDDSHLLD